MIGFIVGKSKWELELEKFYNLPLNLKWWVSLFSPSRLGYCDLLMVMWKFRNSSTHILKINGISQNSIFNKTYRLHLPSRAGRLKMQVLVRCHHLSTFWHCSGIALVRNYLCFKILKCTYLGSCKYWAWRTHEFWHASLFSYCIPLGMSLIHLMSLFAHL